MSFAVGNTCSSNSSLLGPNSTPSEVIPVRLPPGRCRLLTSPAWTGSTPVTKTIGMVGVAAWAASAEVFPPIAAITDTR